jgi:thioredoxin reductase (NADPH)
VLAAVVRDLRRRYAARFRILPTSDSLAALSALEELALAEDPVALIVADQRMPALSGTELLTRSRTLHPDARAVLLTAYADTDAAIEAINKIHLDQYILKPWDPPEESLYPVLDELLDDWEAGFHPPFDGIRLVGHRWSAESHRLREFLARNLVPFRWLDVERDAVESQRLRHAVGHSGLPLVVLADGTPHVEPSIHDLAAAFTTKAPGQGTAWDSTSVTPSSASTAGISV